MRKLDARWDLDVPGGDTEEGETSDPERVHFGIRLGRGRHEAGQMASEYANTRPEPDLSVSEND